MWSSWWGSKSQKKKKPNLMTVCCCKITSAEVIIKVWWKSFKINWAYFVTNCCSILAWWTLSAVMKLKSTDLGPVHICPHKSPWCTYRWKIAHHLHMYHHSYCKTENSHLCLFDCLFWQEGQESLDGHPIQKNWQDLWSLYIKYTRI